MWFRRVRSAVFIAIAAACASGCSSSYMRATRPGMPPASSTICALGIPSVRTSLRDTSDGIDVTFNLVGDATELRRRADAALVGTYPVRAEGSALSCHVCATISDEPNGIVIHAVPVNKAQLESVREAFHQLIVQLQLAGCG